ncbi:hypothetical protein R3P38DRAFT_3524199 [Favolaschia claudopus]|uniref:Uncharacterized protein n=1 Tax=Favolaschia claudopus TaxID=2862362 RepID=A0AAW0E8B9_9AGAR
MIHRRTGPDSNVVVCPAKRNDGANLTEQSRTSIGASPSVTCEYGDDNPCKYSQRDRSLSQGPATCPVIADVLPRIVAAITVGAVAFFMIVITATLFCCIRRVKRKRVQREAHIFSNTETPSADTISPFTLSNQSHLPGKSALAEQLQAATNRVAELEDQAEESRSTRSTRRRLSLPVLGSGARGMLRSSHSNLEAQLHAARHEISTLAARFNALEADPNFSWGRLGGVREEPPPEYSGV